jgi:periplasmic protein TonB
MAYTDMDRSTINPKGMAAAVLINGGGALAALLLGSSIFVVIDNKPIRSLPIDTTQPVPIEQPVDEKQTKEETKGQNRERTAPQPQPTAGTNTGTGPIADGGSGEREVIVPPIEPIDPEPIKITPPVIVGPQVDPRFANVLQPEYPPSMIRAGQAGAVTVKVRIGTDGRVKEVVIVSATTDDFAEATKRQALRKWRFRPATRDGVAEEGWRTMTVKFEIPE